MSLDLYREEAEQALDRLPRVPIEQVEVPFFHNPIAGGLKVAAEGAAKTARAVSMLAAPVAVLADQALSGYGYGTEIQDRFFQQHQDFFDSAVKYWTPKPDEVGMAGQIVGSLASMLPLVMAGPGGAALAVGSQVLSQAEDLVEKGVPADKAVGVGVVQGAGLATGIWMPILGQNLWQRVVLGGAGFNVLQGVTTRAGSQLILEGEKAAEMFPTFDPKMLTLDLLLGMAFGGVAHVSPEMRAQGKDVWARIANWAENLTPEQVDALAALRQAEHMNVETAPGVLRTPADVEANVNRAKSALESLLRDEAPQVDAMPKPSLEPDRARQVDAETRVGELRADVPRVAAEEGIPELQPAAEPVVRGMPEGWVEMAKLPAEEQPSAIGGAIERRLVDLGMQADEAAANGAIWRAIFDTATKKYGVQAAELMRDYGIDLQRMRAVVPGADAALAMGGATGYGGGRGRLEQTAGTRPEPEVLQRTVAGGSPAPGWIGATRISRAGRPLPFYRGSELELRPEHFADDALGVASGNPSSGLGVWFTNTRSEAATYGKVQEAYLDLRKPLVVRAEDLQAFETTAAAAAHRRALQAQGYDGMVITAKHLGGKTHVVAFDAKQVVPIGGHGEYAQGVKPGPMFYSELARQIQTLPETRVPAEGLTAAEWKALLIEPESRRTVAIRDEKNRPTGKTREVVSPEKVRLPGVVMDEIKWSGLQEWLELQGSEAARAKGWATARFEPKREGGDIGTIVNGEGKMLLGIISRADAERTIREQQALSSGKITRQQVSDFLEQNGVRVDEVMSGGEEMRTIADAPIAAKVAQVRELGFEVEPNPVDPSDVLFRVKAEEGDYFSASEMEQFSKLEADEASAALKNADGMDESERAIWEEMAAGAEAMRKAAPIAREVAAYMAQMSAEQTPVKYGQYQLPGAKEGSYRELLLTLPERPQNLELPQGWRVERMSTAAAEANLKAIQQEWEAWRTEHGIPEGNPAEIPRRVWDRLTEDEQRQIYELRERWETEEENAKGGWTLIGPDGAGNILSGVQGNAPATAVNRAAREFLERKWLVADGGRRKAFTSTHWDEENILAHVRFNERTDADGRRVLFVEEIQSDWAQKGKKEGFAGPNRSWAVIDAERNALVTRRNQLLEQAAALPDAEMPRFRAMMAEADALRVQISELDAEWAQAIEGQRKPPAAPFVQKTEAWVGLVLKRMIRYAAENGFDSVAWTRGEQQVDRYTGALRKAVDSIEWTKTPEGVQIVGYKGKGSEADAARIRDLQDQIAALDSQMAQATLFGRDPRDMERGDRLSYQTLVDRRTMLAEEMARLNNRRKVVDTTEKETALSDAIGKSMAERIINDPAQSGTIEGENIRVDDTGMASFYDRIVPNVANQILKKLGGGKVREVDMRADDGESAYVIDAEDIGAGMQQGFDLTPQMRERAMAGQVMFQRNRGQITFRDGSTVIGLFEGANASTFVHESGHLFLQIIRDLALRADAPAAAVADWARLEQWLGIEGGEINTAAHEQFARGWEKYLAEGEAPTPELRTVFQQFRDLLLQVYRTLTELDVKLTDEIRGVMDRMLASEATDPSPARARATTEAEGAPAPTGRAVPPPPRVEAGEARATPEAPEEPDPWLAVADAKAAAEPAPQLGLENEDVRAILLVMAETEAGWAEIGGRHLGGELGQPNFSAWVPRADWWPQREGKLNEAQTKEAVRKALAGEKLKKKEQLAIDYMVKIAAERAADVGMVGKDEWDLTAEAVHAEGLEPTTRNVVDAALVARAAEISEGAVERLAVMYEADDAGFMAAVRRMIDAHHEESRRIRQDLEAARSRAEAGSGQPGPAGAGPEGAAAPAAGAGRAAGGDTGRTAGEPQGPAAVGGEAAKPDPLRQAAEDFVAANPERLLRVGTNADGTQRTMTAQEYLDEARAQAELARQDVGLFEVAARCMLGGS